MSTEEIIETYPYLEPDEVRQALRFAAWLTEETIHPLNWHLMENQNVTISIPRSLLKKAKVLATSQGKSLSQLLRESLEEMVKEKPDYQQARKRQLRLLRKGFDLGTDGQVKTSRDELHARK